jgi:hypothetical protein
VASLALGGLLVLAGAFSPRILELQLPGGGRLKLKDATAAVARQVRRRRARPGEPEPSPEQVADAVTRTVEQATLIEGLAKRSRRGVQRIGALTRLPTADLEALRTEGSLPNHAWDRLAEIALNDVLSSADAPEPTA